MEKMKLNIQMFATILSKTASDTGSPTCYYTVAATVDNSKRTQTTANVTITVTSQLSSSSASLGTGSTYGLIAHIDFNGTEKTLTLKATDTGWSGTTAHTKSGTWDIPCAATATSLTNIKFWVYRTGGAAGGSSYAAQLLTKRSCSNITGIVQGLVAPTFNSNPTLNSISETTVTVNSGSPSEAADIYFKIGDDAYALAASNTTNSVILNKTGLTANTSYTMKIKFANPQDGSLFTEKEFFFKTDSYPSVTEWPANSIFAIAGAAETELKFTFNNPKSRQLNCSVTMGGATIGSGVTYGTSLSIKVSNDEIYKRTTDTTTGTIGVTIDKNGYGTNESKNYTVTIKPDNARPIINKSYFYYQAVHLNGMAGVFSDTSTLVQNYSYLQIKGTIGIGTGQKYANITNYSFTFNGRTVNTNDFISSVWKNFNGTATYNITANQTGILKVVDSRGFESSETITIKFVGYSNPVASISAARRGGFGTTVDILKVDGNYTRIGTNNIAARQYKIGNGSWIDYTAGATFELSENLSTTVYARVQDGVGNWSGNISVNIPIGQPTMFIDTSIQGVGINCFPENKGLEVVGKAYFKDGQSVHTVNGNGVSGYWHFVDISTTKTYADQPIRMSITKRNGAFADLLINTGGDGTAGTLRVQGIARAGNTDVYYTCVNNVISLYVAKGQAWDSVAVNKVEVADAEGSGYIFSWQKEHLDSLPSGYATASKLGWDGNAATASSANSASSANYANSAGSASYADSAGTTSGLTTQQRNKVDTWMPVIRNGLVDYTLRAIPNAVTDCYWDDTETHDYIATLAMLAFWNGAFNSAYNSNLTYCYQGTIQAKPVVLYNNESGTTATFSLSETAVNFDYIVFMYKCETGQTVGGIRSTTVYSPNGQIVEFSGNYDNGEFLYICNAKYTINGTTVTKNKEVRWRLTPSTSSSNNTRTDNTANLKVYKVIGYRK